MGLLELFSCWRSLMVRRAMACLLVLGSASFPSSAATENAPARRDGQGILPGDRFLVRIQYTNTWSDESMTRKPEGATRAARPATRGSVSLPAPSSQQTKRSSISPPTPAPSAPPAPPAPPAERPRSATNGHEPITVAMTFQGDIHEGGRINLSTAVERVHYWDGEGTDWEIDARRADSTARATEMARQLTAIWATLSPGLKREFIEEQLLGVAIVLLDGGSFDVELGPGGPELSVLEFDDLLEARLPREYPSLLRYPIAAFFVEAAGKAFAPNAADPAPGEGLGERDPRYQVEKRSAVKGRPALTAFGKEYDAAAGIGFKDKVTYDARSGLVLERTYLRHQDSILGRRIRFGTTHWLVRLERFDEASGAPPSP
jgi:hypothetical protein